MAEDAICSSADSEIDAANFSHWQHVKHSRVQKQVDSHNRKHASENRARNIAPGISYFRAEIDDAIPAVHGVNDGLQSYQERSDERPAQMKRRRGLGGGCRRLPKIASQEKTSHYNDNERACFHCCGDELHSAAPLDATPL